ncbi:hypothetical protein BGZ65_006505, partial [Modicella reniformis]
MSSTKDLLPEAISSLVEQYHHSHDSASSTTDPGILREQLRRIPRSTWVLLGSEAHNTGFAAEMTAVLAVSKPAASSLSSSVSMFSTAAAVAKATALLTECGVPRIVKRIARQRHYHHRRKRTTVHSSDMGALEGHQQQEEDSGSQRLPLLLELYQVYKEHRQLLQYSANSTNGWNSGTQEIHGYYKSSSASASSSQRRVEQLPWQLDFLRSGCPEVFVIVFIDCFLEYGRNHGYERDLPADLMEALDYEWRTNSGPAKRAVLALVQTLITCRRYSKTHSGGNRSIVEGSGGVGGKVDRKYGSQAVVTSKGVVRPGLDTSSTGTLSSSSTTATTRVDSAKGQAEPGSIMSNKDDQEIDAMSHQLALTLSEACIALELFFETEKGRHLPKFVALYQQEIAADTKLFSRSGQGGGGGVGGLGSTGGAGTDRGAKRQGLGTPGLGAGSALDPMDPIGRKRLKSSGGTELLLGSVEGSSSGEHASPTTSTESGGYTSSNATGQSSLRSSSYYVEQALAGYPAAVTIAAATTASTASSTASAKLVGLIKAVYPSDQKFLLDQILVEYICWEGSGGRERDADVDVEDEDQYQAFGLARYLKKNGSSMSSRLRTGGGGGVGTGTGTGSVKAEIKTEEWIMETIMSALVSLVIKPEESTTYLQPGSRKWIEPMEIILQEEVEKAGNLASTSSITTGEGPLPSSTSLSSGAPSTTTGAATSIMSGASTASAFRTSAAMGGVKKRRVRSLYNRRVSPFYAILAMFQPRRVTGRVTGMLYLGPEDVETKKPLDEKEELLKQVAESTSAAASGLRKPGTSAGGAGVVSLEPIELEPEAFRIEKRRIKKKNKKYRRRKNGDLDAEEEFDPRQRSARTLTKMDIDGQPMDADAVLLAAGRQEQGGDDDGGDTLSAKKIGDDKPMKEEDESATKDEEESGIKDESDAEGGDTAEGISNVMEGIVEHDTQSDAGLDQGAAGGGGGDGDRMMQETIEDEEEDEEEDALTLAKKAEAARTVCHAPFKVLLFILQYLTKVNQAGALDSWITDALSATLVKVQVQYFEWVLASLIISTSTPSSSSLSTATTEPSSENTESGLLFEDELLRLLAVLVAAQGIGYEPVKSALRAVENVYQGPGAS